MGDGFRAQVGNIARDGATVLVLLAVSAQALVLIAATALGCIGGLLTPTGPDTYPNASAYRAVQHHYLWLLATALVALLALSVSGIASSRRFGFISAAVCTVAGLVLALRFAPGWPNEAFVVGAGVGCVISLAPPIIRSIGQSRPENAPAA